MSAAIAHNPFALSTRFAGKTIHLGVSGSISCYKAADLLRAWLRMNIKVSATLTAGAEQFVSPLLFKALGASPVYGEMFARDEVLSHLEPGRLAQAMVIAPASASMLSRLATGAASDMLSAQALAFEGALVIAPAMNPRMWANAATRANVETLGKYGHVFVWPGFGGTACGDEGQGRLADLPEIFLAALRALSPQDMDGLNVLVTLGPTREPWDGVRFWSNPSSGRMGAALATCAWLRGASVTALCGPGISIYLPRGINRIDITTAREMFAAAQGIWPRMNLGIFSAAVSDFAPRRPDGGDDVKFKKTNAPGALAIDFSSNPDILKTLAASRSNDQKVLGFAAEITPDMRDLLPLANLKLKSKNADIVAANRVNSGNGAFGAANNSMAVVDRNGLAEIWTDQCKADIAWELCSWLLRL